MAQQLWFLRHGEAEPHDAREDADRRLTARGERQSEAAGYALARLGVEFDALYTSPKVRAADTARIAAESLGVEPQDYEPLADDFGPKEALALLDGRDDDARVLVVGHEPYFSDVVHALTGARIDLKKGGVAAVRVKDGATELAVLLRPRELDSLAEVYREDAARAAT
jgi:phosphohistidine phosphatase